MNKLEIEQNAYAAAIFIDSIYFSTDYDLTISRAKDSLREGGRLLLFYSIGPALLQASDFPKELLEAETTPLTRSLNGNGFGLVYWDLTESDYGLAKRRRSFLQEHTRQFEEEGIGFICENRLGDAGDIMQAIEAGKHKRYMYRAELP